MRAPGAVGRAGGLCAGGGTTRPSSGAAPYREALAARAMAGGEANVPAPRPPLFSPPRQRGGRNRRSAASLPFWPRLGRTRRGVHTPRAAAPRPRHPPPRPPPHHGPHRHAGGRRRRRRRDAGQPAGQRAAPRRCVRGGVGWIVGACRARRVSQGAEALSRAVMPRRPPGARCDRALRVRCAARATARPMHGPGARRAARTGPHRGGSRLQWSTWRAGAVSPPAHAPSPPPTTTHHSAHGHV